MNSCGTAGVIIRVFVKSDITVGLQISKMEEKLEQRTYITLCFNLKKVQVRHITLSYT